MEPIKAIWPYCVEKAVLQREPSILLPTGSIGGMQDDFCFFYLDFWIRTRKKRRRNSLPWKGIRGYR